MSINAVLLTRQRCKYKSVVTISNAGEQVICDIDSVLYR